MIEFVTGNFFDYEADIRINTVNCVGVMGAGVALSFKERYPDMFKDYVNACKNNELAPGKPHIWHECNLFSNCIIINLPTKIHWKNPSEYEYIEKDLIWLRSFLADKERSTITLPALGCGHGGLDWEKVRGKILKYLSDINSKILVFEPSSSTKIKKFEFLDEELKMQNINRLLPSDNLYPRKLLGRSAIEIYYKGIIDLVSYKSMALVANPKSSERENNALMKFISILPTDKFTFWLGLNNSYDIEIAKKILKQGFKAVFVIPYGILKFKLRKDMENLLNFEKATIISISRPNQTWQKYESLNALKFRIKVADITLINTLDEKNIISTAKQVNQSGNQAFYINYWQDNMNFTSDLHARKLGIVQSTMLPNVSPLLNAINEVK